MTEIKLQHWCGSQAIFGLKAAPVLEFCHFVLENQGANNA
jgi:hypothetical protein